MAFASRSQPAGKDSKYIVAMLAVFAIFMELLDSTIVNIALPNIGKEFGESDASTLQWVITGYLLSLVVFIPISGWAGDRFGTKRVFMFALTVFTGASFLCAFAWNIETLIAFRLLQGVGGGMLSPVAFATLWRAFPPEERSRAAGIMVIPAAVAPASGPIVGGLLIQYASWAWIFLINLPIGIAALVIAFRYLREHTEPNPGSLDLPGFALSAAGLASLLYALSEAGANGFDNVTVAIFGASGLALIALFVIVELRSPQPLLDVRIYTNRLFRACNLAWVVTMFAFSSMIFLLTLELQAARGLSALESGFITFTMAIGVMLTAHPASRLYRAVGPRRMIAVGLAVSGATYIGLAYTGFETSTWVLRGLIFVRGLAFGFVLVPLQAATYATVSPSETGRATALYNSVSQFASSLGVAVAASFLTNRLAHHGAQFGNPATSAGALNAFQDSFLFLGIITLVCTAVAILIKDSDAAATMNVATKVDVPEPGAVATLAVASSSHANRSLSSGGAMSARR